jgi:STAS-like domain of unknown function (DUF4325)
VNTKTVKTVKIPHSGLASRSAAARVRQLVEEHLQSAEVSIDLSGVTSVSSSYADELFGILVQRYSLHAFTRSINLIGASPSVLTEIATAIQYRLNRDAGNKNAATKAAKDALEQRDHWVAA